MKEELQMTEWMKEFYSFIGQDPERSKPVAKADLVESPSFTPQFVEEQRARRWPERVEPRFFAKIDASSQSNPFKLPGDDDTLYVNCPATTVSTITGKKVVARVIIPKNEVKAGLYAYVTRACNPDEIYPVFDVNQKVWEKALKATRPFIDTAGFYDRKGMEDLCLEESFDVDQLDDDINYKRDQRAHEREIERMLRSDEMVKMKEAVAKAIENDAIATKTEDELLDAALEQFGGGVWKRVKSVEA